MKLISWLAHFFSAVGAINWGLVKFFNFNLVTYLSTMIRIPSLAQIIYAVVALAGIYALISLFIAP